MRRVVLALWVVSFGLLPTPVPDTPAFAAPTQAQTASSSAVPGGVIRGRITDPGGSPVGGACVTAHLPGSLPVGRKCTDAAGNYEFTNVTYESIKLYAAKAGFRSLWWPDKVDYAVGQYRGTRDGLVIADFVLGGTAVGGVAGHVKRQDGSGAAFAQVALWPTASGSTGAIIWFKATADGTFSRNDVPPGQYQISVTGSGYAARQWHPGQTDRANAAVIDIAEGATATVVEQFLPVDPAPAAPAVVTTTGQITSYVDGSPMAGAAITVYDSVWFDQVIGTAVTGADGRFSVPGMPSDYVRVKVTAPGFATRWAPDNLTSRNVRSTDPINVVMRPGSGTLRLHMRDYTGDPPLFLSTLTLQTADGAWVRGMTIPLDGEIELTNMPPGQYRMWLNPAVPPPGQPFPPTQYYPGKLSADQAELITIGNGQTTELNWSMLAPATAEVTVLDAKTGAPISDACVTLHFYRCSGVNGVYSFDFGWQTGSHWLTISHAPHHFPFNGKTVHIEPGKKVHITMLLEPGAVIAASFTHPGWESPAGHGLCLYTVRGTWGQDVEGASYCGTTDEHGAIVFGPFTPGSVNLFVRANPVEYSGIGAQWVGAEGGTGDRRLSQVFVLGTGEVNKIPVIRLDRGGQIWGEIRHTDPNVDQDACVFAGPGMQACTTKHEDGAHRYGLFGIGPYQWPLEFRGGPHDAPIWSGGADNRFDAVPVKVDPENGTLSADAILHYGVGLHSFDFGGAEPDYWTVTAFDAMTGDVVSQGHGTVYGLGRNRPVVLRFDRGAPTDLSCWVHLPRTFGRSKTTPYLSVGDNWKSGIKIIPGQTCMPQEPGLLTVNSVPRRSAPSRFLSYGPADLPGQTGESQTVVVLGGGLDRPEPPPAR